MFPEKLIDWNPVFTIILLTGIWFDTLLYNVSLGDYIQALVNSREQKSMKPFREFMMEEHVKNLKEEIKNYNLSLGDDSMEETVSQHMHR